MITTAQVFSAVALAFGVEDGFHSTPVRTLALTYARFAAWKILRDSDSMLTLQAIANLSGGRDHGAIIHGVRRANDLIATDEQFRERFNDVLARLQVKPVHLTTIYT